MNKSPVVLAALLLFLFFKDINIRPSKFLIMASASVFGVYLIHMNRSLKVLLLDVIFDNTTIFYTPWLLFYIIIETLVIFIGGIVIDQLRIGIVERIILSRLNPMLNMLTEKTQMYLPNIVIGGEIEQDNN